MMKRRIDFIVRPRRAESIAFMFTSYGYSPSMLGQLFNRPGGNLYSCVALPHTSELLDPEILW
jgi:hypothetical protein